MKTQYQYVDFRVLEQKPKTAVWGCFNTHHGEQLGEVRWYGAWRQYVYTPVCQAVYSVGCLNDIADFVAALNILHRPKPETAAEATMP